MYLLDPSIPKLYELFNVDISGSFLIFYFTFIHLIAWDLYHEINCHLPELI